MGIENDKSYPQISQIFADCTVEGGENYLDLFRSNGTMYGELGHWRNGSSTPWCEENREVCLATRKPGKVNGELIPTERIEGRILLIRGHKVLLDRHLAELYGVTTGNLNKAVDRNEERFPEDFAFRLNSQELDDLKFHFGTSLFING